MVHDIRSGLEDVCPEGGRGLELSRARLWLLVEARRHRRRHRLHA